jgi:hypothetical protein
MGVFNQTYNLALFAVMPIPGDLVAKWFCASLAQSVLLGIVTFFVYKPAAGADGQVHTIA